MHTQTRAVVDDGTQRHLTIARTLLERALDDLEQLERDAAGGELVAGLGEVALLVAIALEELP